MPSTEWNEKVWNGEHAWPQAGDEWSAAWGGAEDQWQAMLRPRLHRFLPAAQIVEIAPGFGRWTRFLAAECDALVGIDLSPRCVEACRARFADQPHLEFRTNDGATLVGVADESVDLVFSFDSLVHVELDVLSAYLREVRRTLRPGGVAFLHHSNLGQYRYFRAMRALESWMGGSRAELADASDAAPDAVPREPARARGLRATLVAVALRLGLVDRTHMRALSVSSQAVRDAAARSGLHCVSQELFPWGASRRSIDCISVLVRADAASGAHAPCRVWNNTGLMRDAMRIRRMSETYRRA